MIIEIYNKVKNTYDVIYNIIIYSHILQLYSMYMNIEYIYIYIYNKTRHRYEIQR